jgi:hypothetical protein
MMDSGRHAEIAVDGMAAELKPQQVSGGIVDHRGQSRRFYVGSKHE